MRPAAPCRVQKCDRPGDANLNRPSPRQEQFALEFIAAFGPLVADVFFNDSLRACRPVAAILCPAFLFNRNAQLTG